MSNFQEWINNADMPVKQNGMWVDLETGIAYDSSKNYCGTQSKKSLSDKARSARNTAKFFGGKALQGTAKQKEWAEKIRASIIEKVTEDQAVLLCRPQGLFISSKFWIENRTKSAQQFGEMAELQAAILKRALTLKAEGKAEEYKVVADQYNALTASWGF